MTYRAPIADIVFTLVHVAGLERGMPDTLPGGVDAEFVADLLNRAGQFAGNVLAPTNRAGDTEGARLEDGKVFGPFGWRSLYERWVKAGWGRITGPAEFGGMGLSHLVNAACSEMWASANMSFALNPMLTSGAVHALAAHASPELRRLYLGKLVAGEWTATVDLTEAQAGSDVGALRTRAERRSDGSYAIFGEKSYITYGEHDLAGNIVHLVLARVVGAPSGTRGLSLFLVPKFLAGVDGEIGPRNDLRAAGLERKLGLHASPTCSMVFGDAAGAAGWLIGEENQGLECVFTMMNVERLGVGLLAVGVAERAFQQAAAYARDRRQGRAQGAPAGTASPIDQHPDVRRMLLTMRVLTQAARAICYITADAIDRSQRDPDPQSRRRFAERAGLLIPLAKAFAADAASEVASLGVQVYGGIGFIEATGAAQLMRDVRVTAIFGGTNGIQAIDLLQRKLGHSGGATMVREIAEMRNLCGEVRAATANVDAFGATVPRLTAAIDDLERATSYLTAQLPAAPENALAGATPYLRLFGLARGGTALAAAALASYRLAQAGADAGDRIATARFFAEHIAVAAPGLAEAVIHGAASVNGATA